jgi:hypothetical protein
MRKVPAADFLTHLKFHHDRYRQTWYRLPASDGIYETRNNTDKVIADSIIFYATHNFCFIEQDPLIIK